MMYRDTVRLQSFFRITREELTRGNSQQESVLKKYMFGAENLVINRDLLSKMAGGKIMLISGKVKDDLLGNLLGWQGLLTPSDAVSTIEQVHCISLIANIVSRFPTREERDYTVRYDKYLMRPEVSPS